jgi:ABC-2 type transport system permease protein
MVTRVLAIAWTELVRLFRDRSNVFFVLVLPLLLVVLIGAGFGGSFDARLGVVAPDDDPSAAELIAALEATDGVTVVRFEDEAAVEDGVGRGRLSAGVLVPDGYDAALQTARPVEVGYVGRPDASAMSIRALVQAAIADQATAPTAGRTAAEALDREPAELVELVELAGAVGTQLARTEVRTEAVGGDELAREFAGLGQFDLGASTQLFLFTFLTALTGSASLIQTRELGVARRMLSTATPTSIVLGGQAAGRVAVALLQAGYLVVATWLLFRVDWGDPLASGAVIVLFSLVAGGAGMLVGATFRNDSQASGVGIGLGIGLAALGGSMVPLEVFPPGVRAVAHVTPHAWANEAMAEIVRRDGGIGDVTLELAVLAAYAAVLLVLATWRLRRVLTR